MSDRRTALITGASVGLGREFAKLCAADGHDVVLVARSHDKLQELADELTTRGVRAFVVPADLADSAAPAAIEAEVARLGLTIDLLINNAGFGSNGAFLDLDRARELEMVQVNIAALVDLTHRFALGMRARGFGQVLNIASTAGFQPGPFMATYYATKAFVISFSEALAFELRGTGVRVTCHCPGATATEFAGRAGNDKTPLFQGNSSVASASEVAAHAYRAMRAGRSLAIFGALNQLGVHSLRFSPRGVVQKIAAKLNRPAS